MDSGAPGHKTTYDARQSFIEMLEPAAAASATVDFAEMASPATAAGQTKLQAILAEHGFAIVANVLSTAEIEHAEALWGSDLLRTIASPESDEEEALLSELRQDPVHRWPLDDFPLVVKQGVSKFATDYGLPQASMPWFCRQHENVRAVFASLFKTRDICCGTDVVFFNNRAVMEDTEHSSGDSSGSEDARSDGPVVDKAVPALKVGSLRNLSSNLWPHADQNVHVQPSGSNQMYQGVLYLWPSTPEGDRSSTVVWPGSHRSVFPRLMKSVKHDRHYCALPAVPREANRPKHHSESAAHDNGGGTPSPTRDEFLKCARRVPVPAGGLLLWDSKTLHQGWPHGLRLAVPIGYEPAERRTEEILANKQRLVLEGLPTDHWASLGMQHRMARGPGKQASTRGLRLTHTAHLGSHLLSSAAGSSGSQDGPVLRREIVECL